MTRRLNRGALLTVGLSGWLALAIAPHYRQDWLLENVLVVVALPVLLRVHRLLSDGALLAVAAFLALHTVGAHYTYSEVPYDAWARAAFGWSPDDAFGLERNHFDRAVHFLFGLLVTPALAQWLEARTVLPGGWRVLVPFSLVATCSTAYELIEWAAALVFGGELGQAYLGTQGDVWDAQKDAALALLGAALALTTRELRARGRRAANPPTAMPARPGDSDRVPQRGERT